jgi:rubrerythrin
MRELNLEEILKYAEKVETESYGFYTKAAGLVKEEEVIELVKQLASEEIDHQNSLRALRHEKQISDEDLNAKLKIEVDLFDRIINTEEITEKSTSRQVLQIALERENNTEKAYAMMMTFSNLPDNVINLFERLRQQEEGHAVKIQNRLKAI